MVSWQYRWFSSLFSLLPQRFKIYILFFRRFKRLPNLAQPQTFNEKLNWRKLNEPDPLFTIAADKIASKQWVKSVCPQVMVPQTLWQGTDFLSLDVNALPSKYVIKGNHGSRMNLFYPADNRPGQLFPDIQDLERIREKWFKHDQYATLGEWGYKHINKQVFVEEFLDFKGTVPDDYKMFVYHGKVEFIQLDTGRFNGHHRNMYDANWTDLNIDFSHPRKQPSPPKPDCFDTMIKAAEQIGQYFTFVRVDFYQLDGQVYFGELTIYPGAGYEVFERRKGASTDIDLLLGKPWDITQTPTKKSEAEHE